MLDKKTKRILDNYKQGTYNVFKITRENENRIDLVIYDIYKSTAYLQFFKIFAYLNDIVYPQDELVEGRYVKVFDLDDIKIMLNANNINISEQIFF